MEVVDDLTSMQFVLIIIEIKYTENAGKSLI